MSLYKYFTPERIDVLRDGYIRFTQPFLLNDPFDSNPLINLLEDEKKARKHVSQLIRRHPLNNLPKLYYKASPSVRKIKSYKEYAKSNRVLRARYKKSKNIVSMYQRQFIKAVRLHVGILCLSETPDNLLMWAHYSKNHTGFVLEFDENHAFFHPNVQRVGRHGVLHKIRYLKERPLLRNFQDMDTHGVFFVKSLQWEYEQEWRLVRDLSLANKVIGTKDERVCLFSLPPSCIKAIIFGASMPEKTKDEVRYLLRMDMKYSHLQKFQSRLGDSTYSVVINRDEI